MHIRTSYPITIRRKSVMRHEVQDALDGPFLSRCYKVKDDRAPVMGAGAVQGNVQLLKVAKIGHEHGKVWLKKSDQKAPDGKKPHKPAKEYGNVCVKIESNDDTTEIVVSTGKRHCYLVARRIRQLLADASELRTDPQASVTDPNEYPELTNLLGVYANQFGSYTTLLWQVPALGLTAQAFLLTIALGDKTSSGARIMASGIAIVVALLSARLMHNQRGRAINHGELLRRVSEKLDLKSRLGNSIELEDAVPRKTDAQNIWGVDHRIYGFWASCMILFALAEVGIIFSAARNLSWLMT